MKILWNFFPVSVQKGIVDFLSAFVAALGGFTVTMPSDGNWKAWALAVATGLLNIFLNVVRRQIADATGFR